MGREKENDEKSIVSPGIVIKINIYSVSYSTLNRVILGTIII